VTQRKSNVKVGIAGWSYPDWNDTVYPRARKLNRLHFLAQFFPSIEINSTFYRIPAVKIAERWCADVSDFEGFSFTVKLLQDFTHTERVASAKLTNFSRNAAAFKQSIQPLQDQKRLGAILVQFPYSFHFTSENLRYLEQLFSEFEALPLVVEVRHRSFQARGFFDFLKQHGVGFVNIDQPPVSSNIHPTAEITSSIAYVRFHGRNSTAWFDDRASRNERYDYSYSRGELREWLDRIDKLAESARVVYVVFNNHFRGQEVANALEFLHLWTTAPVRIPAPLKKTYPRLESIALDDSPISPEKGDTLPLFPEE